jgi:hypothetical protein
MLFAACRCIAQDSTFSIRSQIRIRKVPDTLVQKMQKDKAFLYANDPSLWPHPQRELSKRTINNLAAAGKIIKWILYILFVVLLLFTLYQVLVVNGFTMFMPRSKRLKMRHAEEETVEPGNIDEMIRQSVLDGRFRDATRYLYLKTLQILDSQELITLQAKATNNDYIRQMANSRWVNDFRSLTSLYEFVWYGEFQPNAQQFESINHSFNRFHARV